MFFRSLGDRMVDANGVHGMVTYAAVLLDVPVVGRSHTVVVVYPLPCLLLVGGVPACGPPASFSVHLTSSAVTPAGSVHKSRGDNVVCMWVQLKR